MKMMAIHIGERVIYTKVKSEDHLKSELKRLKISFDHVGALPKKLKAEHVKSQVLADVLKELGALNWGACDHPAGLSCVGCRFLRTENTYIGSASRQCNYLCGHYAARIPMLRSSKQRTIIINQWNHDRVATPAWCPMRKEPNEKNS